MGEKYNEGLTFICHQGLERSKAAANALKNKLGFEAKHFPGGTQRLSTLSPDEIRDELGKSPVTIIYDQGSSDREYRNKEAVMEKLRRVGIKPTIINTAELAACLHEDGIDINDYLY